MESIVAPITETVQLLLRSPPNAEWGSNPYTIPAAAGGCALAFLFLQLTGIALPRGTRLKFGDQLEWNLRVVSTIHAIVLVVGSFLCLQDSFHYSRDDFVHNYSWPPDFFARIFIGYLLYDLAFMLLYHPVLKDNSGIIHHCIFIPVTAYVLVHSIFKFPFVWLSFCEVSTPFLNLRWRLAVLGMKEMPIYLYNGITMMAFFFLARVVFYGAGLLHLFINWDLWWSPKYPVGYRVIVLLFTAGYLLNLYWMAAIFRAAKRALWRKKSD